MVSAPRKRKRFLDSNRRLKRAFLAMYSSYLELLDKYTCPYCMKRCRRAMGLAGHLLHIHYAEMRRDFEELEARFFAKD
jgi:hypothetical protein